MVDQFEQAILKPKIAGPIRSASFQWYRGDHAATDRRPHRQLAPLHVEAGLFSLAIDSALDGYSLNTNKQTQETVPPSRLAPLRTGPFSCASVAPCLKSPNELTITPRR